LNVEHNRLREASKNPKMKSLLTKNDIEQFVSEETSRSLFDGKIPQSKRQYFDKLASMVEE